MLLSKVAEFCTTASDGREIVIHKTAYKYGYVASLLVDYFGDIEVTSITPLMLNGWQRWLEEKPLATETTNGYKRVARTLFNRLANRDIVEKLPERFWKFKKPRKKDKAISQTNYVHMLANSGIRDAAILFLIADSARRRGGLCDLHLDRMNIWFDEDDKEYRMVANVTEKGEKPQLFVAGHEAVCALNTWLWIRKMLLDELGVKDHGYVFISLRTGQPLTPESVSRVALITKRAANIAESERCNLHAFRHKKIKELIKHLDWAMVRDIAGHEQVSTTFDIYGQNNETEMKDAFFKARRGARMK